MLFLYFLLAQRFWMANIFALALIFSKETGGAAYAVTLVAYVVAFILGSRSSRAQRIVLLRSHAPLAATPLAVMTYMLLVNVFRPVRWAGCTRTRRCRRSPIDSRRC